MRPRKMTLMLPTHRSLQRKTMRWTLSQIEDQRKVGKANHPNDGTRKGAQNVSCLFFFPPYLNPTGSTLVTDDELIRRLMGSKPESKPDPVPPKLSLEGHDTYLLGDFRCTHTELPPTPSSIRDDGCALLRYLGLYWSPVLQALVQPSLSRILLHRDLLPLLDKTDKAGNQPHMLSHISQAFNIHDDDTPETIYSHVHEGLEVSDKIPGLRDPERRFACNVCGKWVDKIPRHKWAESKMPGGGHAKDIREAKDIQGRYTIPLFNSRTLLSLRVALPESWKPPRTKALAIPSALTAPSPLCTTPVQSPSAVAHVQAIGYLRYLSTVDFQHPTELVALIEPPSKEVAHRFPIGSLPWKVETTLQVIRKMATHYVLEADQRVSTAHPVVRDAVTYG
jgi:hypothetical protein